jgi:hypothetical protein
MSVSRVRAALAWRPAKNNPALHPRQRFFWIGTDAAEKGGMTG